MWCVIGSAFPFDNTLSCIFKQDKFCYNVNTQKSGFYVTGINFQEEEK